MANPTYPPYILANLALYIKWVGPSTGFPEGEYWQFILVGKSGKVFFYSPVLTDKGVNSYLGRVPFKLQQGDYVDVIHFWVRGHLIYRGNTHYLIHPRQSLFTGKFGAGKMIGMVEFPGKLLARGVAGRKAARIVRSKVKPWTGRSASLISSNLRPNPEVRTKSSITKSFSKGTSAGPWVTTDTPDVSYEEFRRSWTGVRTPGFGKLKTKRLPVNPHTVNMRETYQGPLYFQTYNTLTNTGAGNLGIFSLHYAGATEPTHDAQARNIAIKRLVEKASLGIDANLAQDFAQIGQTVELIAGTAKRITRSIVALRRGNLKEAADTLFLSARHTFRRKGGLSRTKSLAENWLELQYGWKPLLNDVYGTMKSLASLQEKGDHVQRTRTSGTAKTETELKIPAWLDPAVTIGVQNVRRRTTCKITLYWAIDNHLKAFLAQTGFTNPVNLAWEILPFSFVVDWFLPIGPYLETLSSWDGLILKEGCQVLFTKQITDSVVDGKYPRPVNPVVIAEDHSRYHDCWVKVDRTKLTAFPSATFPSFKNGLKSVAHALNGLALLRSGFRH